MMLRRLLLAVLSLALLPGATPCSAQDDGPQPSTEGAGPSGTTTAIAVEVLSWGTRRITFRRPSSILVVDATEYDVTISGRTADGTAFVSENSASLTASLGQQRVHLTVSQGNRDV